MIVVKTPLRISFFGGGSDLPEWYQHYRSGTVISAAIDKYMYITLNATPNQNVRAFYGDTERVDDIEDLKHERIRETLKDYNVKNNIEVASFCEFPTKGTGLGSSSTYTVGLCKALTTITQQKESSWELAERAYKLERHVGSRCGKQDQYAAAVGGFNVFEFHPSGFVSTQPIQIPYWSLMTLFSHLMLFRIGETRPADSLLKEQSDNFKETEPVMREMLHLTEKNMLSTIYKGDWTQFGYGLDLAWEMKRKLASGITSDYIDHMYRKAMSAGALGGKLLGAGGSGFLMLFVPHDKQMTMRQELSELEYFGQVKCSDTGTEVVYDDGRDHRFQ